MKIRSLCMILLIAMLLPGLSSCKKEEEVFKNERYIYSSDSSGRLFSVDVETGIAQFLCPDPLCAHTADTCNFVEQNHYGAYMTDRYVFYIRNSKDIKPDEMWYFSLWQYDIQTGEASEIFDEHTRLNALSHSEPYLFFNSAREVTTTDEDGNLETKTEYDLFRYDMDSGEVKQMNREPSDEEHYLQGVQKGKYCWTGEISRTHYVTDENYDSYEEISDEKKKEYTIFYYDDVKYNLKSEQLGGNAGVMIYSYKKRNMLTDEIEDFIPLGAGAERYGDHFIYLVPVDEPVKVGEYTDTESCETVAVYDYLDTAIYITDWNTGETRRVEYDPAEAGGRLQKLWMLSMSKPSLGDRYALVCPTLVNIQEDGNITSSEKNNRILLDMQEGTVKYVTMP